MIKYNNAPVPDFLTIKSFISVFRHKYEDLVYEECYNSGEAHDSWEFMYLESGECTLLVDGKLHLLSPGQLIVYAPFAYHSILNSSDAVINVIVFSCTSNALSRFSNTATNLSAAQAAALREIIDLGEKCFIVPVEKPNERGTLLREKIPDFALERLARLVELFLIDLCHKNSPINSTSISRENDRLDEEFAALTTFLFNNLHRSLSAEEISSELSISVSKLSKLCKAQCGCGPIDYFLSLKIGAAKRMISEKRL
ncbi:MAG: helix-turn-helix transcriptional regulator, partial [Oscillospiraceae bacterium]|nr:helix-turn-helix transcriptional regulator [Oscillospiraceae bacterium]